MILQYYIRNRVVRNYDRMNRVPYDFQLDFSSLHDPLIIKNVIICIPIVVSLTSRISSSNTMMKLNVSKAQMQNDIDSQLNIIIIILTTNSLKVIAISIRNFLLWYLFLVLSKNFLPDEMIKFVQCQSSFSHYQSRRSFLFDRERNRYWYWKSHSNIFV